MPDKSKRRKNKNKRNKNKKNRTENATVTNETKTSIHVNNSLNSSCENIHSNASTTSENCDQNTIIQAKEIDLCVLDKEVATSSSGNQKHINDQQITNQDFNNNSGNTKNNISCDPNDKQHSDSENVSQGYLVESPEQSTAGKNKLNNTIKSKSLDDDDVPDIEEISVECKSAPDDDDTLAIIDTSNVIVSDVESDVEWEKIDELSDSNKAENALGTVSVTAIPMNFAQCDLNQSLSPDAEVSLRQYLRTLNLATHPDKESSIQKLEIRSEIERIVDQEIKHRLRKKASAEEFSTASLGPPRILDVIDEEGSSESSISSRRHSHLIEKKMDSEDLDDDVFEDTKKVVEKSSTKFVGNRSHRLQRSVPQPCLLVGAKMKESDVNEARVDWRMQTVETLAGAEVVYLTDTSSSTSSIYEAGSDDVDDGNESSVRMITPTIEVTDTESLLKKTFLTKSNQNVKETTQQNDDRSTNNSHLENAHEVVVTSFDNIKTDLYVKDINETDKVNHIDPVDVVINSNQNEDIKNLKTELKDAFNILIKEVSSDDLNDKTPFFRQDSSSSSVASQCTAKYNPTCSSLNDITNIPHDDHGNDKTHEQSIGKSHVKDVFESIAGSSKKKSRTIVYSEEPSALRDLCLVRIASLPYGEKILEELAAVSERLYNANILNKVSTSVFQQSDINRTNKRKLSGDNNMPYYPLPDISTIDKVILPSNAYEPIPPPIKPRNSSLKKTQDDSNWTALPTKTEPVFVCLSPSQKMLMEKTNTIITKENASQLVDSHKKFVDRRGYNEIYTKENYSSDNNIREAPVIPFKSQTGSRLLALIRDPSVTNIKPSATPNFNFSELRKNFESLEKKPEQTFRSLKEFSNSMKPVPPPRARKFSSSYYESDESSDFTDCSLRSIKSEKKFFHYSTGQLNKEIESDVSSIQNLHRYNSSRRDLPAFMEKPSPRRPSLPKDLCDEQMEYIRQKEKEVEAEIERLEKQRNKFIEKKQQLMVSETESIIQSKFENSNVKSGNLENNKFSSSQEELHRDKMYSEYVNQMAARQERKEKKIIKITNKPAPTNSVSKSTPSLDIIDSKVNNPIEKEFICKARERWNKLGIQDPETEDERDQNKLVYREPQPKVIEHKIKVIEGGEEKDVKKLPSHLQDFVRFTAKDKEEESDQSETVMITPTFKARSASPAIWRPGAPTPPPAPAQPPSPAPPPPPPPPVWTPAASPQSPRKNFRPVHFEETPPARRKFASAEQNGHTSGSESESKLRTSQSAPATGLNNLSSPSGRLPKVQNPTVTLLQKARDGQLSHTTSSTNSIQQQHYQQDIDDFRHLPRDRPAPRVGDAGYSRHREYLSDCEVTNSSRPRAAAAPRAAPAAPAPRAAPAPAPAMQPRPPPDVADQPVTLRSEVKDQSKWYKKMYDTIHKNKYDDDYVTIRYKNQRDEQPQRPSSRNQYLYLDPKSGYMSEPEGRARGRGRGRYSHDDVTRASSHDHSPYLPSNKYSTLASARASQEVYKNQPGKIENYVPGKSSVVDRETKQWWDEVMDIFDGNNMSSTNSLPQSSPREKKDLTTSILSNSHMARALKESGYSSDSSLVFRRRAAGAPEPPLSPRARRAAYSALQHGGEPPARGFRAPPPPHAESESAPAPPRRATQGAHSDTESPRRYVEDEVNIHYKCPVRHDPRPLIPERELARQQADHMKRLYREQKRNKYLQELQDMQNRRHQDNFTPSQKAVVPLNRYDDAEKIVAKALYTFNGQTHRELSFKKGDIIRVRRQIDANWYEGEIHGKIGLFPYNYVELVKGDTIAPKKAAVSAVSEGRARAKFDFTAQTNLELPLKKGELVTLTRRVDQNWWEGSAGNRTGIFPDTYVEVLQAPTHYTPERPASEKPAASPAAHGVVPGGARPSMGPHSYVPIHNSPALSNAPQPTTPLPGYTTKGSSSVLTPAERGYGPPSSTVDLNNTEPLYVDTNAEAVPYRAMYKYRPQNPDELELVEGDTVYVLEQCDDGWFVGSSQRTGRFGTFPGNYVERI